jgi:hypothetical protein
MLRKTMVVLLTAAALTGGVTADAFARGDGGGGGGQVPLDASAAGMGMHGGAHAFPSRAISTSPNIIDSSPRLRGADPLACGG